MSDFEHRIKDWTDRASSGVAPVTAGEVGERSASRNRRHQSERRRIRRTPLLAAAGVLFALTTVAFFLGNEDTTNVTTLPGPGAQREGLGGAVGPGLSPTDFEVAWTDEQGNLLPTAWERRISPW